MSPLFRLHLYSILFFGTTLKDIIISRRCLSTFPSLVDTIYLFNLYFTIVKPCTYVLCTVRSVFPVIVLSCQLINWALRRFIHYSNGFVRYA